MVPQPCYAVVLLYPLTERLSSAGQPSEQPQQSTAGSSPYFCKQTISNACGTVALLHAALNSDVALTENSFFDEFRTKTLSLSADERAAALHDSSSLDNAHAEFANQGQTRVPSREEKVNTHFVCFVHHNGGLYQLDGRKDGPIYHGVTSADTILSDTASVVQSSFMATDPSEHRFTVVALTANPE